MKKRNLLSNFQRFPNPLWAIAVIALAAIIFRFDGLMNFSLGKDGGRFSIDGRPPSHIAK